MRVRLIAPTDVNWSFDAPAYRVYFWKRPVLETPRPPGISEDRLIYTSYEYELTECHNVREALAWADENVGPDRTYTLYATVMAGEKRALIRVFGVDPTKHKGEKTPDWPGQVYLD